MGAKLCRVSVLNREGVAHSVEVTAASLYEAVAIGLRTIRDSEWTGELPANFMEIKVSVASIPVEHTVQMRQFDEWLQRKGGSPADITRRNRVRQLLGGGEG
jgi:hypothetical protein